jgi:hypothetical protein
LLSRLLREFLAEKRMSRSLRRWTSTSSSALSGHQRSSLQRTQHSQPLLGLATLLPSDYIEIAGQHETLPHICERQEKIKEKPEVKRGKVYAKVWGIMAKGRKLRQKGQREE